jgi:hypothetical protein
MKQARAGKPSALLMSLRLFLAYGTERETVQRAFKVMLVVGTLLTLINHGQELFSGMISWHWVAPTLLTYLVPFCVATYGEVQGKMQRDRTPLTAASPDKEDDSEEDE